MVGLYVTSTGDAIGNQAKIRSRTYGTVRIATRLPRKDSLVNSNLQKTVVLEQESPSRCHCSLLAWVARASCLADHQLLVLGNEEVD